MAKDGMEYAKHASQNIADIESGERTGARIAVSFPFWMPSLHVQANARPCTHSKNSSKKDPQYVRRHWSWDLLHIITVHNNV